MKHSIKKRKLELSVCLFLVTTSLLAYMHVIKIDFINYDDRKALRFNSDMIEALYNLALILACYDDEKYRN